MTERATKIKALITWTFNPEPLEDIYKILEQMSDEDLLEAMTLQSAAGRIAWAEYGNRKNHCAFRFHLSKVQGDILQLDITGDAKPVTENVVLDADPEYKG